MNEKTKVKKPFYKKWWVWLIAIIIIIAITSGGDDDSDIAEPTSAEESHDEDIKEDDGNEEAEPKEEPDQEVAAEEEPEKEEKEKPAQEKNESIPGGTYKVGEDIPAGEYLVFSDGMGYIESAKDSTGELDSILFNDNLMNGAHSYVTLNDGEYFKMTGGEMYPIDSAPSVKPDDNLYTDGMYKVGEDIPAGEYKVILDSDIDMGYLEVSSNSSHLLDNIITNEVVQADMYITVKDGQYLKLQDAYIQN